MVISSRVQPSPERVIKYWVPLLSLIVAIGAVANGILQTKNARDIRFDAFNLDLLKLQIDAGAALVTSIDNHVALAMGALAEIEELNRFIEQDLQTLSSRPDPDGKIAQAIQLKFKEQASKLVAIQKATEPLQLQRQVNTFAFTVPMPSGRVLTAALPNVGDISAAAWFIPIGQAMAAYTAHDAAGLTQAFQRIAAIDSEVSAARGRLEAEGKKWDVGKTRFICALQIAQARHSALGEMPAECSGL